MWVRVECWVKVVERVGGWGVRVVGRMEVSVVFRWLASSSDSVAFSSSGEIPRWAVCARARARCEGGMVYWVGQGRRGV